MGNELKMASIEVTLRGWFWVYPDTGDSGGSPPVPPQPPQAYGYLAGWFPDTELLRKAELGPSTKAR